MDRAIYHLTVLMASGCVGILLVSTHLGSGERTSTPNSSIKVTQNGTN